MKIIKKTTPIVVILSITLTLNFNTYGQETETQAKSINTLIEGATSLLGPVGTLVELGIKELELSGSRKEQIEKLKKRMKSSKKK